MLMEAKCTGHPTISQTRATATVGAVTGFLHSFPSHLDLSEVPLRQALFRFLLQIVRLAASVSPPESPGSPQLPLQRLAACPVCGRGGHMAWAPSISKDDK